MYDCSFNLRQYDQLLMSLTQRVNTLTESYNSIISNNNLPIFLQNFSTSSSQLKINWTTVALNPSNISGNRIWNIVGNSSVLDPKTTSVTIVYNFTQVESGYTISFEGIPSGTLNYGELSLNASLYTIVDYNYEAKTITVIISNLPVQENTSTTSLKLFWNLFLDDTSSTTGSASVVFTTSYTALATSVDGINTPSYISLYYYYLSNLDYGILNVISASANTNTIYINGYTSGSSQLQVINGSTAGISLTIEENSSNTYSSYFNAQASITGTLNSSSNFLQSINNYNAIVLDFSNNTGAAGGNISFQYSVSSSNNTNTFLITQSNNTTIYLYFTNIEQSVTLSINPNISGFSSSGYTLYIFGLTNSSSSNTVNQPASNTFYSYTFTSNIGTAGTFDSSGNFST